MKKTNLVFFTWENTVFLRRDLNSWIELFKNKHWDFNLSILNATNWNFWNIESELLTLPFMSEFRMVVIEWLMETKVQKSSQDELQSWGNEAKIAELIKKMPDEVIAVFVQPNPDKRSVLYKTISEIWTIKEFGLLDKYSLYDYIRTRLINADNAAINKLIFLKWEDIRKIEPELDKLELFRKAWRITESDITEYVSSEIEVSAFELADGILALDSDKCLRVLNSILQTWNMFSVFSLIMTSIRNYLYSNMLAELWFSKQDITSLIGIHPFAFEKFSRFKKNNEIIQEIYTKLIEIDFRSKTWDLPWDSEMWLRMAFEKVIFDLKNPKNSLK